MLGTYVVTCGDEEQRDVRIDCPDVFGELEAIDTGRKVKISGEVVSIPIDKEVATRMMVKSTAFDQIKHMMNENETDAMKLAKIREMIRTAETMMGER